MVGPRFTPRFTPSDLPERSTKARNKDMNRYERKLFFERLVAMREVYRTETHRPTELTVETLEAFARTTFAAAVAADVAAAAKVKAAPSG
jgi:hypothetical protein